MALIALIPARGRSVGIPKKNLAILNGFPLIQYTLEVAKNVCDLVIVTSDDHQILKLASKFGAIAVKRPPNLSMSSSSTEDAIMHATVSYENDHKIVLLQPTSPLRSETDVIETVSLLENGYDSSFSAYKTGDLCVWKQENGSNYPVTYSPIGRKPRQLANTLYVENGAVYAFQLGNFRSARCRMHGKVGMYEMPRERSLEIDEPCDLIMAEALLCRK